MGLNSRLALQGDDLVEHFSQDVEPILNECKALHNAGQFGSSEMRNMGKIPEVLVIEYMSRNGINFEEFCGNQDHMKRFLEDPAISHFRIWKGRI